jgi:hypothetical protein
MLLGRPPVTTLNAFAIDDYADSKIYDAMFEGVGKAAA